ncbi:MAG TPA: hypothetical protein VK155_09585 [Bacteroidales bacterium]|jgi:hypothetical protein|nr:hypothetical protein [Bacteroidales bacterium]
MKKIILATIVVFIIAVSASAQDYKTGIGLRAGYPAGLTVKHFLNRTAALEGLLSTRWGGFVVTGLFEAHKPLADVDRLHWFYGFGAHVGFWNGHYNYNYWGEPGTAYTLVGIDGILGLEYNFKEIPVNIGLDWKPAFNLTGYQGFWGDNGALSIRYIF